MKNESGANRVAVLAAMASVGVALDVEQPLRGTRRNVTPAEREEKKRKRAERKAERQRKRENRR